MMILRLATFMSAIVLIYNFSNLRNNYNSITHKLSLRLIMTLVLQILGHKPQVQTDLNLSMMEDEDE